MDTLAFGYVIPAIRAYSELAPIRQCLCRAYNAKSVQLNELHAFAYCLLCVYLSALLNLLEVGILDGVIALGVVSASLLTCVSTVEALSTGTCARLSTTLIHLG